MELGVLLGTIYLIQVYDQVAVMTGRRAGLDERAVLRLPAIDRRRLGVRPGVVLQHRGRDRLDHHRHDRASCPVESPERRGGRMSAEASAAAVGESRWVNRGARAAGVAGRPDLLLPRVLDGPERVQGGAGREHRPKLFFDPTLDRYRRGDGEHRRPAVVRRGVHELGRRRAGLDADRAGPGDPGRLRARHPAGAQVARRAVLLHLDEVPAGRGLDPADLDPRPGARAAEHAAGADHPLHGRSTCRWRCGCCARSSRRSRAS